MGKKILVVEGEEYNDEVWSGCWDSRLNKRRGIKNNESGHFVCGSESYL